MFAKLTDAEGWNWRTLIWLLCHRECWHFCWIRPQRPEVGYFWYDGPHFYLSGGVFTVLLA